MPPFTAGSFSPTRVLLLTALVRAVGDLGDGRLLRLLAGVLVLTLVLFSGAAVGLGWTAANLLAPHLPANWQGLGGWLSAALGGGLVLLAGWFGFAAVAIAVAGCFTDAVAGVVEKRHWRHQAPPQGQAWWAEIAWALRFLGLTVALNLAVLPLVLIPPVGAVAFLTLNAWLMGRQTFEGLARRRLNPAGVAALYQANRARIFCAGLIIAFISVFPAANLVSPVLATAFMLHLFDGFPQAGDGGDDMGRQPPRQD